MRTLICNFYRDESRIEVDLLDFTDTNRHQLIEIKSSQTYQERFARHLGHVGEFLGVPTGQRYVTARVEASFQAKHAYVCAARDWLLLNDQRRAQRLSAATPSTE